MNGEHAKRKETPHGRIAAHLRAWIYSVWPRSSPFYPPDYADFEIIMEYQVSREIIIAKIGEAKACGDLERSRAHTVELLELDAKNGEPTPIEDCK